MKKISVIMSVHNGEHYLPQAIESILQQTHSKLELLICDDGSTDRSWEIVKEYSEKDSRIKKYRNNINIGLTKNLNRMIEMSDGNYIARMDADDISYPDRIARELAYIEYEGVDVVFSRCRLIDSEGKYICDRYMPDTVDKVIALMEKYNYIPHPTVMFRKDVVVNCGCYNEDYLTGQDHELWLRMIAANCKFGFIDEPLLDYRINMNNSRRDRDSNINYELSKVCINNCNKRKAINYMLRIRELKKVFNIMIRLILPKHIYLRMVYNKSRDSRKIPC